MERLRDILVTDRALPDVQAANEKGTYNDVDLNRVLLSCSWLAGLLEGYGYTVPGEYFPAVLVHARVEPPEGGTVKSTLAYKGESAEVSAVPADDFDFKGWTESGKTVSASAVYSFTAERDRELVAVFEALSRVTGFIPRGETETMITADKEQFFVVR